MAKNKNKTVWGVLGVILTVFGVTGAIPSLINKGSIFGISISAVAVIIGIILMAWAFSD
jgi:hypothetical protein